MPYCSILECKNDSRTKNLTNGGISYHRFSKDPTIKEKWINSTGRLNWMPTKSSTICSEHFLVDDFFISAKGYRYLKPTAFPVYKFVNFFDQQQNCNEATAASKRQGDSESSNFDTPPKKKGSVGTQKNEANFTQKRDDVIYVQSNSIGCIVQLEKEKIKHVEVTEATGSTNSTPRERKLKGQLRFCENKIKKQGIKIKQLQSRNRRLKKKINNIYGILKSLEEKYAMSK